MLFDATGLDTDGTMMLLTELMQLQLQIKQMKSKAQEDKTFSTPDTGWIRPSYIS